VERRDLELRFLATTTGSVGLMLSRLTSIRLLALSKLVALLVLGAALALAAPSSAPKSPRGVSQTANKRAANRDGQLLLSRLVLPADAISTQREPPGGGSALTDPGPVIASRDVVDQHAWWVVPQPVQAVLAFIRAHPPFASQLESSGSGGAYGVTTSWSLRFSWPPIASVLYARALSVLFVALPDGSTAVRADAGDMWDIPRPLTERIPSSASVLDVIVERPRMHPSPSITVTDTATVSKIAAMINHLATVQPVAISCPEISAGRAFVTFTFRATKRGAFLAQAIESASATGSVPPCETMQLTISEHTQTPLLGGASVVEKAQALLGVSLRESR
jgi:hypothetical protein